jgi:transcription-repair coupling factor (superfamily II helicase)
MASTSDADRLDDLEAELVDRFGPLPPPSKTLLVVHRIRQRAATLGIRRFELGAAAGVVEFGPEHRVEPDRVVRLVKQPGGRYRLDGPNRLRLKIETADASARVAAAREVLEALES